MLLKKVTIHKYKSFLTEQSYTVEDRITRIVGKNESGKTALLEALAKSNYFEDNADFQFDKDLDYPRSELIKAKNENPAVLTCEYELSDEDVESVEDEYGEGIISKQTFFLTSYYDNTRTTTGVTVDFNVFKNWLITSFDVGDQGKELLRAVASFSELNKIKKGAGEWKNPLEGYIYLTYISPAVPKLWYFSDYFSLPCRINLNEFATGKPTGSLSSEEFKIAKSII